MTLERSGTDVGSGRPVTTEEMTLARSEVITDAALEMPDASGSTMLES